MNEFEYEVIFRGSQWTANVLVFHEADSEGTEADRDAIQGWAEAVADQNGLMLGDYHEVSINKTGELV